MEAGSLGLTPNSLCKAKSLFHFIISVEMVNFLLGSYKKKGGAHKCIFQFFLLMLRISVEILIFRFSARKLGLSRFCSEKAKNLLRNMPKSCSKVVKLENVAQIFYKVARILITIAL